MRSRRSPGRPAVRGRLHPCASSCLSSPIFPASVRAPITVSQRVRTHLSARGRERRKFSRAPVRACAGGLDHAGPLRRLLPHEGPQVLRRASDRSRALGDEVIVASQARAHRTHQRQRHARSLTLKWRRRRRRRRANVVARRRTHREVGVVFVGYGVVAPEFNWDRFSRASTSKARRSSSW